MIQDKEVFERNLAAIAKKSPKIADEIREHEYKDIDFAISRSDDIVLCYKKIPLHSLEDPIEEAKATYDTVKNKDYNSIHVVFGLGLGYLFKRATLEIKGTIVLYEPHMDVLRATLEIVDFSKELEMDKVWVATDIDKLKYIFNINYYKDDFAGVQMLSAYRINYPDLLEELKTVLNDSHLSQLFNQTTILNKAKAWSLAALNNIFDITKYPNVSQLQEKLKDVPSVIVSAGPSLDYTLETLKKYQDKILIISVGQALKALDKAGIKPHIVAVIENLNVSQQFEGVSFLDEVTVMLQPMTHRAIYKLPVKRFLMYFPSGDFIANWYGRSIGRDVRGYPNKGTVSICAYYAAMNSGSSPIMLIGQDLAFRDGNRYAKNSSYEGLKYQKSEDGKVDFQYDQKAYEAIGKTFGLTEEEFKIKNERESLEATTVKGWDGEILDTTYSYTLFMNYYADIAKIELKDKETRLINCSVGGAYIEGLEHLNFEEALEQSNLDHGVDIQEVIDQVYQEYEVKDGEVEKIYTILTKTQQTLVKAKNIANTSIQIADKLLLELNKNYVNTQKANQLLDKLSYNDQKLVKTLTQTELINPFIQHELFEYTTKYARNNEKESSTNKTQNLKENIIESYKLYKAVISGVNQINDELPEIYKENKDILCEIV